MENLIKEIEKLKKENSKLKKQLEKIQSILFDKRKANTSELNTSKDLQESENKE